MVRKLFLLADISVLSSLIIILSILSIALFDIFGLSLFFIFITNFISGGNFYDNRFLLYLNLENIKIFEFLILIGLTYICRFICVLFLNYIVTNFSLKEQLKLKIKLLQKLSNINIRDLNTIPNSKILNIFSNHMNKFSTSLESFFKLIADFVLIAFLTIFLIFINPIIILIAIFVFIVSFLFIRLTFTRKIKNHGIIYNKALNLQFLKIKDFFTGLQSLKFFEKENNFISVIINHSNSVYKSSLKRTFYNAIPRQLFELIVILFMLFLLGYLTIFYSKSQLIEIISIFILTLPRFIPSLNTIIVNINNLKFSTPAVEEIYRIFFNKSFRLENEKMNITSFKKISLQNIIFKKHLSEDILFSLKEMTINTTDIIGITGESGVGKTTLIDLIIGQISPNSGQIMIDQNIYNNSKNYILKNVALVPQEHFIFKGSLHENITFENDYDQINKKRYIESLKFSKLDNFVTENTSIEIYDNGSNLSGGQKQRISIARAYYLQKNFLVLDEPTSALDENTENQILDLINNSKRFFTIIIISHRKNALSICKEVYNIANNKVIKV